MQEREAHLAELMKAKLQKFVDGDKEGFRQQIQNEADRIAAVPFGVPMLEVIGYIPVLVALAGWQFVVATSLRWLGVICCPRVTCVHARSVGWVLLVLLYLHWCLVCPDVVTLSIAGNSSHLMATWP